MPIPRARRLARGSLWVSVLIWLALFSLCGPGSQGVTPREHPVGRPALPQEVPVPRPSLPPLAGLVPLSYPDNWPMYGHDTFRTGNNPNVVSITRSNVSGLREVWSFKTNGSVFTSPLVVNGTVYFGSWDGYLYALNASNGVLLWKTYLGQTKVPACRGNAVQGISSSPQLWNRTVYVGGGAGSWYALNATNGSIEWNLTVGNSSATGGSYNWASPLIYRNELYIGLASDCDNPLVRGGLLEVNLTGPLSVRTAFYTVPPKCLGDSIWSTPAVDPVTNTIWITTGNEGSSSCSYPNSNAVVVLNATTLARLARWNGTGGLGLDTDFGDGTVFGTTSAGVPVAEVTNKNGLTYEFNRSNFSATGWGPIWSVATGNYDDWSLVPSVFNGTTYFVPTTGSTIGGQSYAGSLWGLRPSDGAGVFHVATVSANRLPPAYANGVLAVPSGPELEIVSSSTGATLASFSTGASDTNQFGPAVFGDGRLFAGTGNFSFNGGVVATTTHGRLNAYEIPFNSTLSAAAGNANAPAPVNYTFWANTTGGTGGVRCAWDFGDASSGFGCTVTHTYATGGNLTVRATVTDDAWGSQTLSMAVTIRPPRAPFAVDLKASALSGVAPCNFTFQASPKGTYTAPVLYYWRFGDGNATVSSAPTVGHLYTVGGTFPVEVLASDGLGNATRAWLNVTIGPRLSIAPNLTPLVGTAPLAVHGAVSVSGGLAPYGVVWKGDDGSGSLTDAYATTFWTPGAYSVNLTVTDARGVPVRAAWTVVVSAANAPPLATLAVLDQSYDCVTGHVTMQLHAAITGAAGPYSYLWTFGDGFTSAEGPNVSHVYARAGQYTVSVEVANGPGPPVNASGVVGARSTTCPLPSSSGPALPTLVVVATLAGIALLAVAGAVFAVRRRRHREPKSSPTRSADRPP